MGNEWIIKVLGREYGPIDLETLREWKNEGRVLATNEVRHADADNWSTAAKIPGLFDVTVPPIQLENIGSPEHRLRGKILGPTFRICGRGFFQFLGLTLLIIAPSIAGQLAGAFIESAPTPNLDLVGFAAAGFALCMFLLNLALWPIYIAGIQILTAELSGGKSRVGFLKILKAAAKFWPRIAALCIIVYGVFALLMMFALAIAAMLVAGANSLGTIFVALALLVFQIWMFGRWFVNVLFWQQVAVLEDEDTVESLRRSRLIARSDGELSWFRRPAWRGAFIASLWVAFVLALNWPVLASYFHTMLAAKDSQTLMESLKNATKGPATNEWIMAIWLIQKLLQPLLGIAFVLLYFDVKAGHAETRDDR